MKLLVLHIPNTLNYGSMMMAENLFFYLSRELAQEDLELVIVTPGPEETGTRLRRALGPAIDHLTINTVEPQKIYRGSKIEKALALLLGVGVHRVLSPLALSVDGVVVLGGDDFSEDYGYIGPLLELLMFRAFVRSGIDVAMCGQTIGPFYSWRRPLFRHLLARVTEITARDPITYQYLCDEFKLKNVSPGADLAFLPLVREKEDQEIKLNQPYFTIVPSELLWKYARDPQRSNYINCLTELAIKLLKKFNDCQLLILPHVVTADIDDDRLAGRDLYINLKRHGIDVSQMVFLDGELLPCQARQLLGSSQFVITGRMHAAISSFACGVPALSLSYSRKYWGIIGEYLGMKELIIDVRDQSWSDIGEMALKRIDYINDQYEEIVAKIKNTVPEMQDMAMQSIRGMKYLDSPADLLITSFKVGS
jgi:colanic acid/amylovoran biosynthesis protein